MTKAFLLLVLIAAISSILALIYCILVVLNSWKLNSYLKEKYKITLNDSQLNYDIFAPAKIINSLGNDDTQLIRYSGNIDRHMNYCLKLFVASIVLIVLSAGFSLSTSTWFN